MSNKTVDQINAAHDAVKASDSNALDHGITAGKLLTVMFDKVTTEKKKWSDWLKENCPAISPRTDRDYRSLAKHEPAIQAASGSSAATSIRWALRLIANSGKDIHTVLKDLEPEALHDALKADWKPDKIKALGELIKDELPSFPDRRPQAQDQQQQPAQT
jgi:hypothetical protein